MGINGKVDNYFDTFSTLKNVLVEKQDEIRCVLTSIESFQYACDEIERSICCLDNIELESAYWGRQCSVLVSFLPVNQPLYGLLLFGIIPSILAEQTYIRPATDNSEIVMKISEILNLNLYFNHVSILAIGRNDFLRMYAARAEIIIFVGKYDNARATQAYLRKGALLIYSGSGINPFVITQSANIGQATDAAIEARLYNSGQDCAAPGVFLVQAQMRDVFLEKLINKLRLVRCGSYSDSRNIVGPLIRKESLSHAATTCLKYRRGIRFGGVFDIKNNIVFPTVLESPFCSSLGFDELYAPVFNIQMYSSEADLKRFFFDKRYYEYAMYTSIFGEIHESSVLNGSIALHNMSLIGYEQGNTAYGGYGPRANYLYCSNVERSRPILISREINKYLLQRGIE